MKTKNALLLVDLQNDFMPNGALAVPRGDELIPIANKLSPLFKTVIATQDWHPADHISFAESHPGTKIGDVIDCYNEPQILWPVHCVQNSHGADFAAGLDTKHFHIFHKGIETGIESYSPFYDNLKMRSTGLEEFLTENEITDLYIGGLATDYCVLYAVRDARDFDFNVFVVKDMCRGIDAQPGDCEKAFKEMTERGAILITSQELIAGGPLQ